MKQIKKKRNILIIALLITCLVVLVFVVVKLKSSTTTNVTNNYDTDTKEDGILNFSGAGVFFDEYTGDFKASEVAKKLEDVTIIELPELVNTVGDYSEIQLIKYFYQNKKIIKETYGITNYTTFVDFINKINETGVDVNDWYRLDFDKETFLDTSDKNGYAYIEYSVSMKNNEKIKFSLYVAKSSSKAIPYIIDVINN